MLMLERWLFVVRRCAGWLLVGAAVTYSAWVPALGLGDITLHSALNQPLRADIALVDAAGLEEGELTVSLATADEFSRAGVERVFFLNDLKFTPVLRSNRRLIQVTSTKPVNEPFLNFLVQLNQPNGRLLREYTVLIDPPGTPGIEPASDEPLANRPSSAFPSVQPTQAPFSAQKQSEAKPAIDPPVPAPTDDPLAEQLAASVLQNQQLQATIDELNAKLQAQTEQSIGEKNQVAELQARLAQVQQATARSIAPAPVVEEAPEAYRLLISGALALLALVLLGGWVRHRRQVQALPESPSKHEPVGSGPMQPLMPVPVVQRIPARSDGVPANDVLEEVAQVAVAAPVAAAMARDDEFQLNLDDLSMDTSWDLLEPSLPEPEIEWKIEAASEPLHISFLDEIKAPGPSRPIEDLSGASRGN
jgi:pilus assembly protein FimV